MVQVFYYWFGFIILVLVWFIIWVPFLNPLNPPYARLPQGDFGLLLLPTWVSPYIWTVVPANAGRTTHRPSGFPSLLP